MDKVVLITGCSSGIGAATALALAKAGGWKVVATARKVSTLEGLAAAGCVTLPLDVTDDTSIEAAVSEIEATLGPVSVLINNAGYSQSGAVESVPVALVRKQFETNVFGLLALTRRVLPGMRAQRWGRVLNIGSMGGALTFPGGGVYHASKYALEALSDALRFELAGFGVAVTLIQPGLIRTGFSEAVQQEMKGLDRPDYDAFNAAVMASTKSAYETGPLAALGGGPEDVAAVILGALRAKKPKPRYTVTPSATLLMTTRRLLGDAGWDAFLRQNFPQPGKA